MYQIFIWFLKYSALDKYVNMRSFSSFIKCHPDSKHISLVLSLHQSIGSIFEKFCLNNNILLLKIPNGGECTLKHLTRTVILLLLNIDLICMVAQKYKSPQQITQRKNTRITRRKEQNKTCNNKKGNHILEIITKYQNLFNISF